MKNMKKLIALIMAFTLLSSLSFIAFADTTDEEIEYFPLWMEPYSVIIYDANGNPTIIEGGYLSPDEISESEDIALIGYTTTSPDMIMVPNTKVEYDLHGFIQNIYYLVPGTTSEYQLSNPKRSRVGSGIIDPYTTYTYGAYTNHEGGGKSFCVLTRSEDDLLIDGPDIITGTGRITFYTGTYGRGSSTYRLKEDDCATKMYYDDIRDGTAVIATNTVNGKSHTYYKNDVGNLPSAILDIWSDDTINPITKISTNGAIDNVYSATIWHYVAEYPD